jgi:hypothetical protein
MQGDAHTDYTRPDVRSMALITVDMREDFLADQPFEMRALPLAALKALEV